MARPRLGMAVAASVVLAIPAALAGGCGQAAVESTGEVSLGVVTPTLDAVTVALAPRVLPEGATPVTITLDLSGVSASEALALELRGDDGLWGGADLAQTGQSGSQWTFSGVLLAPHQIGQHDLAWDVIQVASGAALGLEVTTSIEVTCSDGVFCNGEERLTKNGCVASPPPCQDGVACTTDTCDEAARTCWFAPGPGCASCDAKKCNPKCHKADQCGDDGCGGKCVTTHTDAAGTCLGGLSCVAGQCQAVSLPGTCSNPLPLLGAQGTAIPSTGVITTVTGDTSTGIDVVKVSCGGEGIKELVYQLDVPVPMGIEIRMLSASGDPDALDTVLAVHAADCTTPLGFSGFCSDDASPPGGLGSRVYGPLDPGSYRLVATGYSASQVGPFQLQVKAVPACVPACDGRYCGSDGCGGECGTCDATQQCSSQGRCFTAPCTPDCSGGRKCGDDGCGGSCGTCAGGDLCAEAEGRCVPPTGCDHLRPVCKSCGPKSYCGSDCQCHKVAEPVIDLIPAPASVLVPSIEFEWRTFSGTSCGIAEGCVPGAGRYLLMRFTTDILNQSVAGFKPGDPVSQPELFDYHDCHQHYHFTGFANYSLLSLSGDTQIAGRKLSYCMEDSHQYLLGPAIACNAGSTCDDQGIQGGWADSYPSTLDCQWLVLRGTTPAPTDVPANTWYLHQTCTNTGRAFHEASFDNNCVSVPVFIPDVPDDGQILKYSDITPPPMP